jgi:hypothetical protein
LREIANDRAAAVSRVGVTLMPELHVMMYRERGVSRLYQDELPTIATVLDNFNVSAL